jgi:hypothetical protein
VDDSPNGSGARRTRLEDDAIYFSRRAREELQAAIGGCCRKARQTHLMLAEAYEIRAHLITEEVGRRDAAQFFYA